MDKKKSPLRAGRRMADGDKPLERYLRIMEVVASFSSGVSASQLIDIMDYPKTTIHRLLQGLVSTGALSAVEQSPGHYRLSDRMLRLLNAGRPDDWIQSMTRPVLQDLTDRTGETCFVARLSNNKIRSVAMTAPDHPVCIYVTPGRELAPHAGASAKAILAFQDEKTVNAVLPARLPKLTSTTKSRTALLEEFTQIRQDGVAFCVGEDVEGFAGIACPIQLPRVGVLYSIGIAGTVGTLIDKNRDRFTTMLKASVGRLEKTISAQLS